MNLPMQSPSVQRLSTCRSRLQSRLGDKVTPFGFPDCAKDEIICGNLCIKWATQYCKDDKTAHNKKNNHHPGMGDGICFATADDSDPSKPQIVCILGKDDQHAL